VSELCITCGKRPRKAGRRQCGPCAYRSEDQEKARLRRQKGRTQRREHKRRLRRAQGAEPMEVIRQRAALRAAQRPKLSAVEREARRLERLRARPWLQFRDGATRYRWRYQNDAEFAQRERERAIVFRFTHPEIAAKCDRGDHWRLATLRADGSVTEEVVRKLLRASSCYLCGVELTPDNRSIDHRIALALGGGHTASNLAPCCLACNARKARKERALLLLSDEMKG